MPTALDDTAAAAERFDSSSTRLSSLSSSLNVEVSEPQSLHAFLACSAIPRPNRRRLLSAVRETDESECQSRSPSSIQLPRAAACVRHPPTPPLRSNQSPPHLSASAPLRARSCTALNAPTVTRLHLLQASGSRPPELPETQTCHAGSRPHVGRCTVSSC